MPRPPLPRSNATLRAVAAVALVVALLQAWLPHGAFWLVDAGEKYLAMRALVAQWPAPPFLAYDRLGVEARGERRFVPWPPEHLAVVEGGLLPYVPPAFPALSAPLWLALGPVGLYVLPGAGGVVAVAAAAAVARERYGGDGPAALLALALGLGSSLLFFSLTFWEHTLAAAAAAVALWLLQRRWHVVGGEGEDVAALAGLLLGLGVALRRDLGLVAVAAVLALAVERPRWARASAVGFGLGLVPVLLLNKWLYGAVLGAGVQIPADQGGASDLSSLARFLKLRLYVAGNLLLSYAFSWRAGLVAFLGALLPALWLARRPDWSGRSGLVAAAGALGHALALAATLGCLTWLSDPMLASPHVVGLMVAFPLAPLTFLGALAGPVAGADGDFDRFLGRFGLFTLSLLAAGLPSDGGLRWGPRYAVAAFPLFAVLAARGLHVARQRFGPGRAATAAALGVGLAVALGVGVQAFGIRLLAAKKEASQATMAAIDQMGSRVVVSDSWWFAEDCAPLGDRCAFYWYRTFPDLPVLLRRLAARGQGEVLVAAARRESLDQLRAMDGVTVVECRVLRPPLVSMFSVTLYRIRLALP